MYLTLNKLSYLILSKARALRHTSALSKYNTRSLHHQCERAHFTIHCGSSFSSTSLVFLKNPACLYNSTMHSARFLFLYCLLSHSTFDWSNDHILVLRDWLLQTNSYVNLICKFKTFLFFFSCQNSFKERR